MATFETQVEALTSLSIDGSSAPTQSELTQFLTDGAKEIINLLPEKLKEKAMSITNLYIGNTDTVMDVDGKGQILYVTRENADSGVYAPCRKINAMYGDLTNDSENIIYGASATDPVYYVESNSGGNSTLFVKPTPTAAQPAKVYHIAYPSVAYGDSAIANFPDEAEYLVPLYGSIKALQNAMGAKSSSLPGDIDNLILPVVPTVPTISAQTIAAFEGAPTYTSPVSPSVGSLSITASLPGALAFGNSTGQLEKSTVDAFGTAPVYIPPIAPVKQRASTWAGYFPNADFPDSDPGEFSITAVPPVVPSISAQVVAAFGSAPVYTAPTIGTTARTSSIPDDLTDMEDADWGDSLDFDFDGENIDFQTWFQTAGYLIQNQEDTELAQAQLQKISTYINAYSQAMQNQLNIFNDANVEYQATIQHNIREADLLDANEARKIQKYSSELQSYQSQVSKEVQEYQQRLSRYQLELGNSLQAWQTEESNKIARYQSDLQKYSADIQNSLNQFNDANIEYQANIQHLMKESDLKDSHQSMIMQKFQGDIQRYQAHVSKEVQEYQVELGFKMQQYQSDIQNALNKFNEANIVYQADIQENIQEAQLADVHEARKIQKYQAEVGTYSAEVNSKVQKFGQDLANYNAKIQKHSTDYQWLQSQYVQLKQDYMQGISILKGGQAPRQGGE